MDLRTGLRASKHYISKSFFLADDRVIFFLCEKLFYIVCCFFLCLQALKVGSKLNENVLKPASNKVLLLFGQYSHISFS